MTQQVQYLLAHVFQLQPKVHQDLGRHAFLLAQEAQQQVFRAHVIVIEISGLFDGIFDDFLGARRLGQLAHGHHVGTGLDDLLDFHANFTQVDVQVLQDVGRHARTFFHQPEQDVFGADVLMVEALRLLIGELHHFAGTIGKAFVHVGFPLAAAVSSQAARATGESSSA